MITSDEEGKSAAHGTPQLHMDNNMTARHGSARQHRPVTGATHYPAWRAAQKGVGVPRNLISVSSTQSSPRLFDLPQGFMFFLIKVIIFL